jgi:lipopolysaccharide exporter
MNGERSPHGMLSRMDPPAGTPRGIILTGAAAIGGELLLIVAGLLTARFLGPRQLALAGAVVATLAVASRLRDLGIAQRLVQMPDDPGALYDLGFSLELWLSLAYLALSLAIAPVVALLYGDRDLVALSGALALQGFAPAVLFPLVRVQRDLDWRMQRRVEVVGPAAGALVTIALAAAGAGAWAVVLGQLAITASAGVVLWRHGPGRPRLVRLNLPAETRRFLIRFGGPLWGAGVTNAGVSAATLAEIQLAAGGLTVGYARLALTVGDRIGAAETVLANLLFPVLARVPDRDTWRRAFHLSQTLILLWAVPAGLLVSLLAGDIADHVLGDQWHAGEPLLRFIGIAEIVNAIGTTWVVFYAATGNTVPQLLLSLAVGVLLLGALPAVLVHFGITGMIAVLALGVALAAVERLRRLHALLPRLGVLRGAAPLLLAGGVAAACAALVRNALGGAVAPFVEVAVFGILYAALVYALAGRTLRVAWSMLVQGG